MATEEQPDAAQIAALLLRVGIAVPEEELPKLQHNFDTAKDNAALVHGLDVTRYEEPGLVHRARL